MQFYVYILYSVTLDSYYTGFSKYHAKRRRQHCRGETFSTQRAKDWEEAFCQRTETREEARALEKLIKARGAARFLRDSAKTKVDRS